MPSNTLQPNRDLLRLSCNNNDNFPRNPMTLGRVGGPDCLRQPGCHAQNICTSLTRPVAHSLGDVTPKLTTVLSDCLVQTPRKHKTHGRFTRKAHQIPWARSTMQSVIPSPPATALRHRVAMGLLWGPGPLSRAVCIRDALRSVSFGIHHPC